MNLILWLTEGVWRGIKVHRYPGRDGSHTYVVVLAWKADHETIRDPWSYSVGKASDLAEAADNAARDPFNGVPRKETT